ncbi:MAG: hypothetical protein AB1497_07370 [Bacillota bacterium]
MKTSRWILFIAIAGVLVGAAGYRAGLFGRLAPDGKAPHPPMAQAEAKKPEDFFPLSLGSTWDYEGEGNEFASFSRVVLFSDGRRAQVEEDNGGTVLAVIFEATDDAVMRVFTQPEQYERKSLLDEPPNEGTIVLKAPLNRSSRTRKVGNPCSDAGFPRDACYGFWLHEGFHP